MTFVDRIQYLALSDLDIADRCWTYAGMNAPCHVDEFDSPVDSLGKNELILLCNSQQSHDHKYMALNSIKRSNYMILGRIFSKLFKQHFKPFTIP
jgi:hypothetical protein